MSEEERKLISKDVSIGLSQVILIIKTRKKLLIKNHQRNLLKRVLQILLNTVWNIHMLTIDINVLKLDPFQNLWDTKENVLKELLLEEEDTSEENLLKNSTEKDILWKNLQTWKEEESSDLVIQEKLWSTTEEEEEEEDWEDLISIPLITVLNMLFQLIKTIKIKWLLSDLSQRNLHQDIMSTSVQNIT